MIKFEEKNYYSIEVEKEKNRLILTYLGRWKEPKEIPHYLDHMKEAVNQMSKGFSVIAKIQDEGLPSIKVTSIHKEGQQILLERGVKKTAVILSSNQLLRKLTLSAIGRLSGLNIKTFENLDKAKAWLDEY
jgi:hypothetical protein